MEMDNELRNVADSCGVDPFTAVDVVYSLSKPGDETAPWVVRVYVQSTRARVYKQRIITGAGETIAAAAVAAIDAVCEAFRAGDITTPEGVRPQVLADFDGRADAIKATRERDALIAVVMEMDGVPREKAEHRVDRALAQRAEKAGS